MVFNTILGIALERAAPEWANHIMIEKTRTLREAPGKHPDILVAHHSMPPVAIETSVKKGDADMDARARLGLHHEKYGREIQTAIAVELPESDLDKSRLDPTHTLQYALHQPGHRFPESGFMHGDVHDLARFISTTAVPKEKIEEVATRVAHNVTAAANVLEPAIRRRDLLQISRSLYQRSALTGLRTTMILWLNAYVVQRQLHGSEHDIPGPTNTPSRCLKAWRAIHEINWKAIFEPAINILDHIHDIAAPQVSEALNLLMEAVEHIETAGLGDDINIGAELFPKVAEDRSESAAFYTQPATAELLAALTITEDLADWSEPGIFRRFRIVDMACGTGTLLRFGYRQVKAHCIRYGNPNMRGLHRDAMERGLTGTDVSPIAAHLTSAGLAVGAKQPYGDTNIGWVGVGNPDRTGAIEYIALGAAQDLFAEHMGRSTGQGGRAEHNSIPIHSSSADVILMNPPYSRTRGGRSAFDIAGLSDGERAACQKRWGNLIKDEPCVKTAGMAATFLCIARKKVKPGGRIGLVLPRTAAFADTWERTRNMVERDFEDITAVAVASGRALGREALSADTMMEEMLLVAARKSADNGKHSPIKCVTLHEPATRLGEAAVIAAAIRDTDAGPIMVGGEIGVVRTFEAHDGRPWSYVGTVHDTLAVIAIELASGRLYDLEGNRMLDIPMTTVGELFDVGKSHDSIGHPEGGDPRGAFTFHVVTGAADAVGMYRSLWKADAKAQVGLIALPTHKGTPYTAKADSMWATRSTLFYSRNMRFNTQAIVAATTRHMAMGGRAWTSLGHGHIAVRKAFALWANSTYGMVVHWTRGQRTHSGRSTLQVNAIKKLPCPDLDRFDDAVLEKAAAEFDRLSVLNLLPAHMAAEDEARAEIDDAVSEMLGAPGYDTDALAELWCAEPSVRGMK